MTAPRTPPFLARDSYRLRRLMDAARFLPAFGLVLLLLPLMRDDPTSGTPSAASEGVYLFAVWLALILCTWLMARGLRKVFDAPPPPSPSTSLSPPALPASGPATDPDGEG